MEERVGRSGVWQVDMFTLKEVFPSGHEIQFNIESTLNQHWINVDNHLSMLIQCSVPTGLGFKHQCLEIKHFVKHFFVLSF